MYRKGKNAQPAFPSVNNEKDQNFPFSDVRT